MVAAYFCSQLLSTDLHFQALYDVAMIQVLIFNLYVLIRDSYAAGRYTVLHILYQVFMHWRKNQGAWVKV